MEPLGARARRPRPRRRRCRTGGGAVLPLDVPQGLRGPRRRLARRLRRARAGRLRRRAPLRRRVNPTLVQRAVWLAAITLVAAIAALAITRRDAGSHNNLPDAVAVPGTENGYYTAKAAPYGPSAAHRRTACGQPFLKSTEGVAHPVLPCGVRLYIRFQGKEVLTQVVDRGPNVPGREFDITKALADRLDLHGTQTIQWRFAK
ncbi:MAG: hypothetical protein E6G03_00890 [Actinobacteria bacterium]|nr:MAG: hypothetical protein E6G03_00890 [Actinomycetota bacterium]